MNPLVLAVKYFYTPLKYILIHNLYENGVSQQKISKYLSMSQPMVHKVLYQDVNKYYRELEKYGFSREEINNYVSMLSNALIKGDITRYMQLSLTITLNVLSSGKLCMVHHEVSRVIPIECNICKHIIPLKSLEDPYTTEFKSVLTRFTRNPRAYSLVPEVGMNIVYAPFDDKNEIDYFIAVPGRIVRAGYTVQYVGEPCYGCSHHTATVLKEVRKYDKSKKVASVIRYDEKFINKLSKRGLKIVYTGPHNNIDDFYRSLKNVLKSKRGNIDVIADKGGYGLESVIYVFSRSLNELLDVLLYLLK